MATVVCPSVDDLPLPLKDFPGTVTSGTAKHEDSGTTLEADRNMDIDCSGKSRVVTFEPFVPGFSSVSLP